MATKVPYNKTRFEHILNSMEYILLAHADDLNRIGDGLRPPVREIDVVSSHRWRSLDWEHGFTSDEKPNMGFMGTGDPDGDTVNEKYRQYGRPLIHVPQGAGHIRELFREAGSRAICQFRYWDMRIYSEASSNRYEVRWDICLDILVRGDHDGSLLTSTSTNDSMRDHPGIYNPDRGKFVDQVINRFGSWPVLDLVVPHRERPMNEQKAESLWLGGPVHDPPSNPADPDYSEFLTAEWPTGWEIARPDSLYTVPAEDCPVVTGFEMTDGTDLNYWTLLWAHGTPESYQGYFPTTIKFTITEKHQVGIGGTGSAFSG